MKMKINKIRKKICERYPRAAERLRRILHPDDLPLYWLDALLLNVVLESLSRHSLWGGITFLFDNPIAFFVNAGILLLTFHLALFCPKRMPTLLLINLVWLGLGIAQCVLLYNRVTPLTAVDFTILFSVITIMNIYMTGFQMVMAVGAVVIALALIILLFIKIPSRKMYWKKSFTSLAGTAALFALLVALGFGTGHLSSHFTELAPAYRAQGFTYCFSLSLVDRGVNKPSDYGEGSMTGILIEMTQREEGPGVQDPPGTLHPTDQEKAPNVIMVQLESFFDVHTLQGVSYSEDPLPNFTMLSERYLSGLFRAPVVGAGTVNTEFEVLTGMRVSDFGTAEYPYQTIMTQKTCETVAYDLLRSGYRTHAIHNHQGTFYARHEVYKHLGFEDFTPIEFFLKPSYNSIGWAKDSILTEEILHLMASTEEADFVFAVSVQGHGKYPTDYLPKVGDVRVTGGVSDPASLSKLNYYISQLKEMDAFIGELYQAVMALEEDTLLVFYGDHLPSLSQDEALRLTYTDFDTNYLIIANYDWTSRLQSMGYMQEDGTFSPALRESPLPAYQLFPLVMEILDNSEGIINRFHRILHGSEDYLTYLAALEYDVLYGKHYVYGEDIYPVMEDMSMGTRDIRVTGYAENTQEFSDGIIITGENFTPYSVVVLDGASKETTYVDAHTLLARCGFLTTTVKSVTVRQVTDRGEVLFESEAYRVQK